MTRTLDAAGFAFVSALQKLLNTPHPAVLWFDAPHVSFAICRKGNIVAEVELKFEGFCDMPRAAVYGNKEYPTVADAKRAAILEIKRRSSSGALTSIEWRKRKKKKTDE